MRPRLICFVMSTLAAAPWWASCTPALDTDPLSHLLKHEQQRRALCARGREDAVTDFFCGEQAPNLTSLTELQDGLGVNFNTARPGFALQTNSTSLSARSVSSINPRAIFVERPETRDDGSFLSVGYARGEHLVEIGVKPPGGALALYLLRYEQPCHDDTENGCSFADRLTPRTESGWTRWSLYDDVDLANSTFDCLVCHQPLGPGTDVLFRMQEFRNPWTHWMAAFGEGERALLTDYGLAHDPDEGFAGIPTEKLTQSNPIIVENFFKDSGGVERNEFPSEIIEEEVKATNPAQPYDNSIPGVSATWDGLYDRAVRGEVDPPPYHDVKITDADQLASMSAAYRAFMTGELDTLPDIRDVIRDDALPKLSHRPKQGLSGREILVHMCAQCHNGRLDQTITRSRFDATNLDAVPRDVKDAAIERLQRPRNDRFKMPPTFLRELSDDEIALCVEELRN